MRDDKINVTVYIGDQDVAMRPADGLRQTLGGLLLAQERIEYRAVELLLALEVVVEQRLVHACGMGNLVRPRAGKAPLGKSVFGRRENAGDGGRALRCATVLSRRRGRGGVW